MLSVSLLPFLFHNPPPTLLHPLIFSSQNLPPNRGAPQLPPLARPLNQHSSPSFSFTSSPHHTSLMIPTLLTPSTSLHLPQQPRGITPNSTVAPSSPYSPPYRVSYPPLQRSTHYLAQLE